jgi:hypothetical protein
MPHKINDTTVFTDVGTFPAQFPALTRWVEQGDVAISKSGSTNLFSTSFSGCTGLVAIPQGGSTGGMVAHIHQGRHKPGQRLEYLAEVAKFAISHARVTWGASKVDVVLFRGEEGATTRPDLPKRLRDTYHVGEILDLREHTAGPDTVLFEPLHKRVYLATGFAMGDVDETLRPRRVVERTTNGKPAVHNGGLRIDFFP